MRILILFLSTLLCYRSIRAQEITGTIRDEHSNPLAETSVVLKKFTDSSVVKIAISTPAGRYQFLAIPSGTYFITFSHIGYSPGFTGPFSAREDSIIRIPPIQLARAPHELAAVEIVVRKPLVEVKADKIVLNVEGNINAVGENALELLRKSPGVTFDKDNSLSLGGKNGIQVFVDGRPTHLSGNDLAGYLKTVLSSSIESIEIIGNPSAKYEAAGTAGIINIRLKKDKSFGTNLTAGAGYNIGTYSKYNANMTFNHRNRQFNVFGDYTYNNAVNLAHSTLSRTQLDTLFGQQGDLLTTTRSQTFRLGADYFVDKKSTLGVIIGGTLSDDSLRTNSTTPIVYIPSTTTDRVLQANNHTGGHRENSNINLNYRFVDTIGHELDLNADYSRYRIRSNQLQPNNYFDSTGKELIYSNVYNIISPTDIDIYSFKADYEQNVLKGRLGLGGKISYITSENDFQEYDVYHSIRVLDSLSSDNFNYKENINAAYLNYNRTLSRWVIQAGIRMENTNNRGISTGYQLDNGSYRTYDSTFTRHYTDFFPSASISYASNPTKQWTLNYSRRIDRPDYQDLNPFEFKLDDYTFSKGNTRLRPQYGNNIGLTYMYKYKLTSTLSYSHITDLFTTLPDTTDRSKTVISKVNLANQDVTSLNISYPIQFKWYNAFVNVNAFYALYKANFGVGRQIDLNVFNVTVYSQHSFRLGSGWTGQITQYYTSPNIWQTTLKARSLWSLDGGIQKSLFRGNATIKATVSDIFNTLHWSATSNFAGQYIVTTGGYESRQLKLYFTYRLGNKQIKAVRRHETGAEDENKRVSQGGGGGATP